MSELKIEGVLAPRRRITEIAIDKGNGDPRKIHDRLWS